MTEDNATKRERNLRNYRDNPSVYRAMKKRWKDQNPAKHRAHKVAQRAVQSGKIAKLPCERCGATENVHAHHDDYSKPLTVIWLCPPHHKERHKEIAADPVASARLASQKQPIPRDNSARERLVQQAKRLWIDGHSAGRIAKALDLTESQVRTMRVQHDFPDRPPASRWHPQEMPGAVL